MAIKAVIWDFGGVLTTSPFVAFNRYEAERGIPRHFIRSVNASNPDNNAWARFERSEIDPATFDVLFAEESEARGHRIPGSDVLALLAGDVRPKMVAALHACKARYKVGCITNNVKAIDVTASRSITPLFGAGMAATPEKAAAVTAIMDHFDHVIESSKIEIRKPDPRIYALMCEALDVPPHACIYLDDLGVNLKPARAMGMSTIKVENEAQALRELAALTGLDVE